MSGRQSGALKKSSACARVMVTFPTVRTLSPGMRGAGCSFSVVGKAHSGLSAASANVDTRPNAPKARIPIDFLAADLLATSVFMRAPPKTGAAHDLGRLPQEKAS